VLTTVAAHPRAAAVRSVGINGRIRSAIEVGDHVANVDANGHNDLQEDVLSVVDVALGFASFAEIIVEAVGALITNANDGIGATTVAGNALVNVLVRREGNVASSTADGITSATCGLIGSLAGVLSSVASVGGGMEGELAGS
jgi:hypothetical protein